MTSGGIDLTAFDFLDFGSSEGASLAFGIERLGGARGLGVDRDPRKVALARAQGLDVIEGDLTSLDLPAGGVRFVVMSHVLEHLRDLAEVRATLDSARRLASELLYIRGPFFDADTDLARLGLKLYWSDWAGHPCHLTIPDLVGVLHELDLRDYVVLGRSRIRDSTHDSVHPLASPRDQHEWRDGVHPPKPALDLPQPVFREIVACVKLREVPALRWRRALNASPGGEVLVRSSYRFAG